MKFIDITNNIKKDLDVFEDMLREIAVGSEPDVSEKLNYIFKNKGKRVRPILVYLTNRLFSESNKSTHNAALLIELMHNATLLHDDVVDKATLRRGKTTVNSKWDDKTAVLIGDYLFAKSMKIATDNGEYKLFDIITPAIMRLSLGELQQMDKAKTFDLSLDKYYEVIKNKTASLISTCCKVGAFAGGGEGAEIDILEEFGEIMGMIFQIKDDILDFNGGSKTGKQKGIDILENKVTLPVICAWNNMSESQQKELASLWFVENKSETQINFIIDQVVDNDGIKGSYQVIAEYKKNALVLLNNIRDTKAKSALIELLDYIIERDK